MFKKLKRNLILFLTLTLLTVSAAPALSAETEGTVVDFYTTLTDGATIKSPQTTFYVFSKDANGNKIEPSAALNGEELTPVWSDASTTSFMLVFTDEGENIVTVTAGDETLTYIIIYQSAADGELIGYATWSIEMLSLGLGYLIEPVRLPIYAGENAAAELVKLLEEHGYSCEYTGSVESSFYFSSINNVSLPTSLSECNVPGLLSEKLEEVGFSDQGASGDSLGEFEYTYGSGWMYSVNNVFPNVGFSDSYLCDGDVMRVQFTLAYGSDIGGGYAMGGGDDGGWFNLANKGNLLTAISYVNSSDKCDLLLAQKSVRKAFDEASDLAMDLLAAQDDVNAAAAALNVAVAAVQKPYDVNVDGKVNILDMIVLKKIISKEYRETLNSDISSDGAHNSADLTLLRQKLLAA